MFGQANFYLKKKIKRKIKIKFSHTENKYIWLESAEKVG